MFRNPLLEMTGDTRISSTSGVKTARRLAFTRGEAPEPRRSPGELLLLDAGIPVPMGSRPPGGGKFSRMRDLGRCGSPGDRSLLLEVKGVPLRQKWGAQGHTFFSCGNYTYYSGPVGQRLLFDDIKLRPMLPSPSSFDADSSPWSPYVKV